MKNISFRHSGLARISAVTVRRMVCAGLLALVVLVSSCAHTTRTLPLTPATQISDTTLGPGDIFSIKVYGEKELSGKYRVDAKGKIDFPLIGTIEIDGLTPPQVARKLRRRLAKKYLKNPHVSVFVDSYSSKKISVFGEVRRPGTFNYNDNMSIIEAITLAGGFTPIASKNKTTVTRNKDGKSHKVIVAVEEIGEGTATNYLLKAGDVVMVPQRIF